MSDVSAQQQLVNSINELKSKIDQHEDWISKASTSHKEFFTKYAELNNFKIKLKALKDRKSSKGSQCVGYEYSLPKTN